MFSLRRWGRLSGLPLCFYAALLLAQEDPAVKAQRAKALLGQGRFAEAALVYGQLVKQVPGNPGLLLNLGMAQHMAGQHAAAVSNLDAALKIDPNILPANLFLGGSLMKLGQPARAVAPLRRVVGVQPELKDARQLLADALLGSGRPREAIEHYRKWTELEPSSPQAWMGLGSSNEGAAQAAFDQMEKLEPESAWGLLLVGEVRERQRQHSSAYYLYREALKKNPNLPGAHAAIARIYKETGRPEWAAQELKKQRPAPVSKPGALEAHYRQWKTYTEQARRAYAKLGELPPSVEIFRFLAESHRTQGQHREEAAQWRQALKLAPGDTSLQVELAVALHFARDDAAAQKILEPLVKAQPDSARLNFMLGDTLLSQQQPEKAIPYLQKAVKGDPKLVAARSSLGRALLQAGQGEAAIIHLKAALGVDKDGSLHFQLARAYQQAGQSQEARAMTARYQEIRSKLEADKRAAEEEVRITPP
ncbi:MAG: tetratricopeptide repeat protein [Acidimicrobiia bacterium]|nr:tetratricopeptide repeat protein [Acidimicrobiia bacterium]